MNDGLSFCPALDKLLHEGRTVGRSGKRFENLNALSTRNNLRAVWEVLQAIRPTRTLEVGLAFGGSAAVFATYHRESGAPGTGQHVAIDPFQDTVWDGSAELLLQNNNLSGYLRTIRQHSHLALPRLVETRDAIGVAYIDGSHLFEDVFLDMFYTTLLLNKGGVVLFDDSQDRHVNKVIRFVRSNLQGVLEPYPLGTMNMAGSTFLNRCRHHLAGALGRQQLTAFRKVAETKHSFRPWNSPLRNF